MDKLLQIYRKTFSVQPHVPGSALYQVLFPFSFLGIGLYWAWIYLVCFSTLIYPEGQDVAAFAQTGQYVSMLTYVVGLLVSAAVAMKLLRWDTRVIGRLCVLSILAGSGTALMAVSFNSGTMALMVVGAAMTGIGTGFLLFMWGLLFTKMKSSYASMRIALALLVSVVTYILLSFLPYVPLIIFTSLLPVASCLLILIAHNSTEFRPEKGPSPRNNDGRDAGAKNERPPYPKRLGVGLMASGIPLGLLFGMVFMQVNMGKEVSLVCITVNVGISLLILVYLALTRRNLGFSTIYRFIMPISATGLLFAASFHNQFILLSLLLVRTGYALFDILIWLQLQKVFEHDGAFKMFTLSRLCLDGGVLVGLSAYRYVVSLYPGSLIYFIICSTIFLMFTLPVVLTRRRVVNAWFLLPTSSKEAEEFDTACRDISERYCLTKRETEIMALLARGRNGAYIQERLYISMNTFQTHSKNIYRKLDIHSRRELMKLFDEAIRPDPRQAR